MEENLRDRNAGAATLYDVARLAGVSAMTVSRVINDKPGASAVTRGKVLSAIDALKYQVNLAARAARVGTMKVGLLYSNPSAAYLAAFLVGTMDQCRQCGVQLLLERCHDLRSLRVAIARLIASGADGVILPPPLCDSKVAVELLDAIGTPTVAVAAGRPFPTVSAVRIDNYQGARAMTRHLLSLGHTDIAFIKGDPEHTASQLRYSAFVETMAHAGLAVPPGRVAQGMYTYRSGLEAARELLGCKHRPTAVFASNDDMAAAAIAVAHGFQLDVPRELAVVGFDDTPVATTVWPELTTIRQPIGQMARAAVDLLVERIRRSRDGYPEQVQHKLLEYTLVTRGSA